QALLDPNPQGAQRPEGRELLLDHAERELSRDRSQHLASEHLDPLAAELPASLPEPDGPPVRHTAADLLDQRPEPVSQSAHSSLADDLLAELSDPVDVEPDLAEQVAKITARLDALEQPPPSVADDYGIDLW